MITPVQAVETEKLYNTKEEVADSYKTKQAKQKLARLENELNEQHNKIKAHWQQTNGQPMNDKKNGQRFFDRADELENKAVALFKEYEKQAERVAELVERDKLAADGFDTRTGGFEVSSRYAPEDESGQQAVNDLLKEVNNGV